MSHRIARSIVAALVISSAWIGLPQSASACSADADWDPVANSDVIAGGFIQGYTPLPDRTRLGQFIPVRLDMRIDHVWKGRIAAGAEIIDRASFRLLPVRTDRDEIQIGWFGAGGACGILDDDPSGKYVVFGLVATPDGSLQTMRLQMFYLSALPYDPDTVAKLSQRIALPVAGLGAKSRGRVRVEALLAAGVMLCIGGVAARVIRRSST